MFFFLAYQSWNICQGQTTYEVHKRRQWERDQLQGQQEQQGGEQQQQEVIGKEQQQQEKEEDGEVPEKHPVQERTTAYKQQSPAAAGAQTVLRAAGQSCGASTSKVYDRGVCLNWFEVLFPHSFLAKQLGSTRKHSERQAGRGQRSQQGQGRAGKGKVS